MANIEELGNPNDVRLLSDIKKYHGKIDEIQDVSGGGKKVKIKNNWYFFPSKKKLIQLDPETFAAEMYVGPFYQDRNIRDKGYWLRLEAMKDDAADAANKRKLL